MANRKWVRLSVSAEESNQRERNRGRTVGGKNAEERQKGCAIPTRNEHEINKPHSRIDPSLRNDAPTRNTPSQLVKKTLVFFPYQVCQKKYDLISESTTWPDRVNRSRLLYPPGELMLKLVLHLRRYSGFL